MEDKSPIRVRTGESIEFTATLKASEWKTRKISNSWKYDDGQPHSVVQVGPAPKTFCLLSGLIHGNNPEKDLGVVKYFLLDVRDIGERSLEKEIRARFEAPSARGKYVFDIQVVDQAFGQRERGAKLTKPEGSPVWRRELWVQ